MQMAGHVLQNIRPGIATAPLLTGWIPETGAAALLVMNTVSDLRRREILLLPTILLGLAGFLLRGICLGVPATALIAGLSPGGVLALFSLASRGGIGMGDAIAVAALGTWCSFFRCLLSVTAALVLLGGVAALSFLRQRRARWRRTFPFVPFLLAGYGIGGVLYRFL